MHIIFQYIDKADVYSDKLHEQVTNQVILYSSGHSDQSAVKTFQLFHWI